MENSYTNNLLREINSIYIDSFPPLFLCKDHAQPQFRHLQLLRIKYWRKIAQEYLPFRHFYDSSIAEPEDQMANSGMQVFDQFLDNNVHTELCSYIKSIEDNGMFLQARNGYATLEFTIDQEFRLFEHISNSIRAVTSRYYAKSPSSMHAKITRAEHGGTPDITGTLRWHADRFIPVVNGVYFPFGCNWAPFERIIGSPVIDSGSENLLLHHYEDIPAALQDKGVYSSYCKPNTFILGAHHMLHRQKASSSAGKRIALYFESYSLLSGADLVNNYVMKNENRLPILREIFSGKECIAETAKSLVFFDRELFNNLT